jgi:hypothetical protein
MGLRDGDIGNAVKVAFRHFARLQLAQALDHAHRTRPTSDRGYGEQSVNAVARFP